MDSLRMLVSTVSKEDVVFLLRNIPDDFRHHPLRTTAMLLFCVFTAIPLTSFIVFVISSLVFTIVVATFWEAILLLFALMLLLMVILCTTCIASCLTGCAAVAFTMYKVARRATKPLMMPAATGGANGKED